MEVARATSSPRRSSMRRSTPAVGDGVQDSSSAWAAARWVKSAFRSMGGYVGAQAGLRQPPSSTIAARTARISRTTEATMKIANLSGMIFVIACTRLWTTRRAT